MKKLTILMISAFGLCMAACENQSKETKASEESIVINSAQDTAVNDSASNDASMGATMETARLDSLNEDSNRQEALRIKQAMPTPSMFGTRLSDEGAGSLKEVTPLRSKLMSLGYTKVNNNKFVLKSEGKPLVTVVLDYKEWDGEYDEEADMEVGGGMTYTITLTYADKAEADSFYKAWTKVCKTPWVSAEKSGSTVSLYTYAD